MSKSRIIIGLHSLKMSKLDVYVFISFLAYAVAIALGAVQYLPYEVHSQGVFRSYSIYEADLISVALIAILGSCLMPKKIKLPTDWFLIIFVIFLLIPGLVLGILSDNINFEKKIVVLPTLCAIVFMIAVVGKIGVKNRGKTDTVSVRRGVRNAAALCWFVLLFLLIVKYRDTMKFSGLDLIYAQRELTSAVGAFWGYVQLYFTFSFSTLLVAYGLSSGRGLWFLVGSSGYFVMYLITAEKAHLLYPLFFLSVNYLVKTHRNPISVIATAVLVIALIIYGVIFLSEDTGFFNMAGFYLFSRVIVTPSQFVLDYYDFFSDNGYTLFSHIRGLGLLFDAPVQYAADPKWPQLGWIVGSGFHGIESNSNATFIAADGLASLGALGAIMVTFLLCIYLMLMNYLSRKFPKPFWSIILAQQAFMLISGSLFSLMLSFGGFFFLLLFGVYNPRPAATKEGL